ncbi:MAG TPA: N-methyl-L-tryptophan oxidase [Candidatus Acidoferrales bacterium]|nr:N-methyl-L-tryptophan oxidase [Candidatus Acidoferrales bacterium]
MRYEVAVVGLGGMGAAALAHLAGRGVEAIGIERYPRSAPGGASCGETRMIRKAYFENASYVPLLERAYDLWYELEAETDRRLIDLVGVLMVGAPERTAIAGTLRTAQEYDLPIEIFDAEQLARRFPGTHPRPQEIGLLERQGGIVFPERAVEAMLHAAEARGATAIFETRLERWTTHAGTHRLALDDGRTVEASRLVICPGMWAAELLAALNLPLRVQRNVQLWFEPSTTLFDRGLFPAFFVERLELPAPLYGFPAIDGQIKAALHGFGDLTDPERVDRRVRDGDVTIVRDALDEWIGSAASRYARGRVCTYTLTPDGNFVVDRHPHDPSIAIACGFSGHGFKFCPVVGEILSDLVLDGGSPYDLDFLAVDRFRSIPGLAT